MAVKKKVAKKTNKKGKKLRVNSIRAYYLDSHRKIQGKAIEVYGIEQENLCEYNYTNGKQLKAWAMKQIKVDKSRNYKLEVRTTKGRFLFDK